MRSLFTLLVGLCVIFLVSSLPRESLYPFGEEVGDSRLQPGDDISSSAFDLQIPITFYEDSFYSIYVNLNGHLSFETELPAYQSDLILPFGFKVIAGFLSDIDTRLSGNVYYRENQDPSLLGLAVQEIHRYYPNWRNFQPRSLFIVTWDEVGFYNQQFTATNTFQIVIASDGYDSFVMLRYPDDGLNWINSQGKRSPSLPDVPGQAGIDAGDGRRSSILPGSGSPQAANVAGWTNTDTPGLWMFRVGNAEGAEAQEPEYPGPHGGGGPPPRTCAEGGRDSCNAYATCRDYDNGYCCQCNDPYIGNGINCIELATPQRVNGKVSGNVNGYSIEEVDLHAYVVVQDGRTYTAVSRMPDAIGYAMQALFPLGGSLGWLFAVPSVPQAKNGFMITGGDMNRTAEVRFLTGGETVTIRQQLIGQDAQGYMRMTTQVNGNVPSIPDGSKVEVGDYKVEYRRVGPGVIKSSNTHSYRVDGILLRFSIEESIHFVECPHKPQDDVETLRLNVNRNFIVFAEAEGIVRYAQTNKISTVVGVNPCLEASYTCDPNADCVPHSDSYRCICKEGFSGDGQNCQDINECALNTHDCHQFARCENSPGSFQCACLPGYTGDGRDCRRDLTCDDLVCDVNARCVYDSDRREAMCECFPGYSGDGTWCEVVEFGCNEVNNCGENAECVFDDLTGQYQCECVDGFSGDGFFCTDTGEPEINCRNCDPHAQCVYDVDRLIFRCQCSPGFSGDGYSCFPIGDSCDILNNCDRNARCMYDSISRTHTCQCNPGHSGDGYSCYPESCDTARNCDQNARCLFDSGLNRHQCVCNPGYTGDGLRCAVEESCERYNICHLNAQCVYDDYSRRYICRCNQGYEGDGKTCTQSIQTCNIVNDCDIDAECLLDPITNGHFCQCRLGYVGDGYTCTLDADCYNDPRLCDGNARCERRGTDHVCVCEEGYSGDGFRCAPDGDRSSYLLYAQGMSIMDVPFNPTEENPGKLTLYIPGQTAIGIDTDCYARYMYWTDVSGRSIQRAKLDGTDSETILSGLGSPEGVAIDWITKNMYWTDSGLDTIEVSRFDGSNRKSIISEGLVNPRAIMADPVRGLIFWTDWNRDAPKIERSNMDGTERRTLVTDNLGLPNGLTIDFTTFQICWADAGTMHIECVNYEGRNRRTLYTLASYPFDITFGNNALYWTDWDMASLPNINQYSSEPNTPLTLPLGGSGRNYGITTVQSQCPHGTNACALNNGGCRFLCLPTPNGGRTCACPDDVEEEECNRIAFVV